MRQRIISGIMGLCMGDAIGVPVEFMSRKQLAANPVTQMMGHGTHNQPRGTWSDDTSMTLCLLHSLSGGLDYNDIMRQFRRWYREAQYTAHGEVFDIGIATRAALNRYEHGEPALECGGTDEYDNGNGSLMRILPLAFYLQMTEATRNEEQAFEIIHNVSSLTHGHPRSQIGCGLYVSVARMLCGDREPAEAVEKGLDAARRHYMDSEIHRAELSCYARLFDKGFAALPKSEIKSSGYVVHTLEAAIWCLLNTENYLACVYKAANLGDDTDTVAAVAGGLAGICYGIGGPYGIPDTCYQDIAQGNEIRRMCNVFYDSHCVDSDK